MMTNYTDITIENSCLGNVKQWDPNYDYEKHDERRLSFLNHTN